jgi:hypothetical protein
MHILTEYPSAQGISKRPQKITECQAIKKHEKLNKAQVNGYDHHL